MNLNKLFLTTTLLTTIFVTQSIGQISKIDYKDITGQDLSEKYNVITPAVPFLLIAPDSRAGAMGDAGVATSADVWSMRWNPSKYAFAEKDLSLGISYTPWLRHLGIKDINLIYMAGSYKLDKMQALSMSILYFSLGDIQYTDELGNDRGIDHNPNEWAMDFAYSRKLSDAFALGISGRFIYSNLLGSVDESKAGTAGSADISGIYQKKIGNMGDISWGFNISNIGSKISYQDGGEKDFIPTNLRIGGGYNFKLNEYNKLGIYVDYNKLLVPTEDSSSNISTVAGVFTSFSDAPGGFKEEIHEIMASIGVEYWYDNQFAIRGGYFYEHETKGNRKYFSLGVGLKLNVFALDVSYLLANGNSPLANTLRFSLAFDFEGLKAENKAADNI